MKGLIPETANLDQKEKPYFISNEPFQLPPALPDVTSDAKKRKQAEALMEPVKGNIEIPPSMTDLAIKKMIFAEPVFTAAGNTYEHESIAEWLETKNIDPLDHTKLENKNLYPNKDKLRDVNEFLDKYPALRDSAELYLPRSRVKKMLAACKESKEVKSQTIKHFGELDPRLLSWTFDFREEKYIAWRGKTMLHLACEQGTPAAVMQLLNMAGKREEGLPLLLLLKKDNAGKLPIHYAMQPDRDPRMMRLLAAQMGKHLADVKPIVWPKQGGQELRQISALHLAAMNNAIDVINILLEKKADLTIKDGFGHTALHMAVACDAGAAIEVLMTAGASEKIENDAGQTPSALGIACRKTDAVTALLDTIARLKKSRQGLLEDILLKVQQAMEPMQALLQEHPDPMKELLEEHWRLSLVSALGRYQPAFGYCRQLEQLCSVSQQKTVWEMEMISTDMPLTPQALRQLVIDQLPSHPQAHQARLFLSETKGHPLENVNRLYKHGDGFIKALAMFPNGNKIASGSTDGSIKIWDITQGVCILSLDNKSVGRVNALVTLPDGRFISGSSDNTIKIWNAEGKHIATLPAEDTEASALALLNNGFLASSFGNSGLIKIWDIELGTCVKTLIGHTKRVTSLLTLPDNRLVSGSMDKTIKVWNVSRDFCTTLDQKNEVVSLAILPKDRIAGGGWRGTVKIWDLKQNKCIATLPPTTRGFLHALAVLPGYLMSVFEGKGIKIWDIEEYQCIFTSTLDSCAYSLVPLADSLGVVMGQESGSVRILFIGKPLLLDLSFKLFAELDTDEQSLHVRTAVPHKAELKGMAKALETLCPEEKLTITITAKDLHITHVLNPTLLADLKKLCQVFGASKPMQRPYRDLQSSLEIKRHAENPVALFYHGSNKDLNLQQDAEEEKSTNNSASGGLFSHTTSSSSSNSSSSSTAASSSLTHLGLT